jgi:hypothetical protein
LIEPELVRTLNDADPCQGYRRDDRTAPSAH